MRKATILKRFNRVLNGVNGFRENMGMDHVQNISKLEDDTNKFITIYAVSSGRKQKERLKHETNNS